MRITARIVVVVACVTFFASGAASVVATAVFGFAALGCVGGAFSAFCHSDSEMVRHMNKANEEKIKTIQKGLERISSQSVGVQAMLHQMVKDWKELKAKTALGAHENQVTELEAAVEEYDDAVELGIGDEDELNQLREAIVNCKRNLDKLINDIQGTEEVIDTEIKNYKVNIHSHLLTMLRQ